MVAPRVTGEGIRTTRRSRRTRETVRIWGLGYLWILCRASRHQATDCLTHRVAVIYIFQLGPAEELREYGFVLVCEVAEAGNTTAKDHRVGGASVDELPVVDGVVASKKVEMSWGQDNDDDRRRRQPASRLRQRRVVDAGYPQRRCAPPLQKLRHHPNDVVFPGIGVNVVDDTQVTFRRRAVHCIYCCDTVYNIKTSHLVNAYEVKAGMV